MSGNPHARAEVGGLRVLAHPLRLRLLSLLTGAAYSAAEAARALDQSQANVSYHLRRLHAAGLVEPAGEVPVRGGTAKRYRHDPETGALPRSDSAAEYVVLAAAFGEELRRRAASRDMGVPGEMTDAEVWLAPEVWEDLRTRADRVSADLHHRALPPGTPGAVRVSATLAMFVMAAADEDGTADARTEPVSRTDAEPPADGG